MSLNEAMLVNKGAYYHASNYFGGRNYPYKGKKAIGCSALRDGGKRSRRTPD